MVITLTQGIDMQAAAGHSRQGLQEIVESFLEMLLA
jgi:hypothetical protein